ncbi:MAG: squalene--hopene cyclase [Syntrophobacteraceae bacterium]
MASSGSKQESVADLSYADFDRKDAKSGGTDPNRTVQLKALVPPDRGKPGEKTEKKTPAQYAQRHPKVHELWERRIESAVRSTCEHYFNIQYPEGYWWAELESNTSITAEYIMLHYLLECLDADKANKMAKYLLHQQRSDGSWGLYHGDQGNLCTTVESYFALKLVGQDPYSEPLRKARDFILKNGGIEATRVFTKVWLALFSQYDWNKIASMPVELVLLPSNLYFNIYEFSSWARGTAVPLAIVMVLRPKLELPEALAVPELYLPESASSRRFISKTHKLFYLFDRVAKWFERRPVRSLRNRAIKAAEDWIVDHQEETGDWGGIQPPMVYSILALHYLGYSLDNPVITKGLKALEDFCIEDELGLRLQSCISPVWDTALTCIALMDAGVPPTHPALKKAASWLLANQIMTGGDWQVKNSCPPGGWAFEFVNTRYPDVDDSAVVLVALQRMQSSGCEDIERAKSRGLEWCLSMECAEGGWAAFDKDNTMTILNRIPFADQEAMVDYPTEDVSARVLEAMGCMGYDRSHPSARRGIEFLRRLQEPDGCWWGRWGVNYIYGTWSVLRGLIAIGEDPHAPYIQAALQWLKQHQNPDGGWGETCESYSDPSLRGQGPSTASQTAWALTGLMISGEHRSPEVRKGIDYLLRTQQPDGTWLEDHFTGTGFPKHFYIRYHNYRNCFPLMALGQYLQKMQG